jgi:hypothetical protein
MVTMRTGERRANKSTFHLPERRTGFDRRLEGDSLRLLSERPMVLAALLIALNVLSAADWLLTMRALTLGAQEANAFMGALFVANPIVAGLVKAGIMLCVSLVIWNARRYRMVLATAVGAVGLYGILMLYHAMGLATLGAF